MARGAERERGVLVHGDNLAAKEGHRTKYRDAKSREYLVEIREKYNSWHAANSTLAGPHVEPTPEDFQVIRERVRLLEEYKDFLDAEQYATQFDSRSNLHSSVLEQFLYYLFRDMVADFGNKALIGKSHAFKDLFFVPPGYGGMLERPYSVIEKKDHDFVIGSSVEVSLRARDPASDVGDAEQRGSLSPMSVWERGERYAVDPVDDPDEPEQRTMDEAVVKGEEEIHTIDVPAVAIECKTYLDKTMLEGSSRAAEDLKARVPNSLYIVVMEWIKLSDAINPKKFKVDQIYVLRQQKNTDREFRYLEGYKKNPIDPAVVWHLFQTVRLHLTDDWKGGIQHGIQRGWLVDSPLDHNSAIDDGGPTRDGQD